MSDGGDANMASDKPRKGISLWLAASLAVNALLVGVVGGRVLAPDQDHSRQEWRKDDHHKDRPRPDARDSGWRTLSKERQKELRVQMRKTWTDTEAARQTLRAARMAALELAGQEPHDPDALKDALSSLREAENELRRQLQEAAVDFLSTASPQERRALLGRLAMIDGPGGKRDDRDSGKGRRDLRDREPHEKKKPEGWRADGPPPQDGPPPLP